MCFVPLSQAPGGTGDHSAFYVILLEAKWLEVEAHYSPPFITELKNAWSLSPFFSVCLAMCLEKRTVAHVRALVCINFISVWNRE